MSEIPVDARLRELVRSPQNECFGCGPGNDCGLQIAFTLEGDTVRAEFEPGNRHGGWAGIVHGGILATALDEAMSYVLYFTGTKAFTARMEVRFRLPVYRGDRLVAEARMARDMRKIADVEGRLLRDGETVADATGRFMKLGPLNSADLLSPGA